MNRVLIEIVAHLAIFLEQADQDNFSLEQIVRQQEDMVFRLKKLNAGERSEFLRLLKEIASGQESQENRDILERFPEDAGLL